jgi:hypothetical protein
LADLFRIYAEQLAPLSSQQQRVVRSITSCRTAALGGHVQECDHCRHQEISYNSCRDRHCPKCGSLKEVQWVEARQADLLPVEYFHVVFTLPDLLNPLFLGNPKVAYDLLFGAVAETLLEVALNSNNLGARIGFTAVLHTWTQKLRYHPHLHLIVPGGGISPKGDRWISAKPAFFLPVRILSNVFRGKLLSRLEVAIDEGGLRADKRQAHALLGQAALKKWVVYSKPPLAGPEQVLRYLGRYTHRIAISNERLVCLQNDRVTFRWKDRSDGNQKKLMTLDAFEFLRRFLLHVLPRGMVRIRHYGFLANAARRREIARCRELLGSSDPKAKKEVFAEPWQELLLRLTGKDVTSCPRCKEGRLTEKGLILRKAVAWPLPGLGASS